jgi:hypothetical protein
MDAATHIDHVQRASEQLAAAHRDDPLAPAASGIGWNRSELLAHVTFVHTWARTQLQAGTEVRIRFSDIDEVPVDDQLADRFEAGAAELATRLRAMDHAADWPTWAGTRPGSWYPRRMAQ